MTTREKMKVIEIGEAEKIANDVLADFLSGQIPEYRMEHKDGNTYTRWGLFHIAFRERLEAHVSPPRTARDGEDQ